MAGVAAALASPGPAARHGAVHPGAPPPRTEMQGPGLGVQTWPSMQSASEMHSCGTSCSSRADGSLRIGGFFRVTSNMFIAAKRCAETQTLSAS